MGEGTPDLLRDEPPLRRTLLSEGHAMKNDLVFGPVPSRRLGRSLGIDLIPHKHCSYDCVYCQLGRTTHLEVDRMSHVETDDILAELEDVLNASPPPDVITLAGSGEPCLQRDLGALVAALHRACAVPVAMITNGSLLSDPGLRDELMELDVILPSLDGATETAWRAVNRPHPSLCLDEVVKGMARFRRDFRGTMRLEILLVEGLNDGEANVRALADAIAYVGPDMVDLHTVDRPPGEGEARPLPVERLRWIARVLGPSVHVVDERAPAGGHRRPAAHEVLRLLSRRPTTFAGLRVGLSAGGEGLGPVLDELLRAGRIRTRIHRGRLFFEGEAHPIAGTLKDFGKDSQE